MNSWDYLVCPVDSAGGAGRDGWRVVPGILIPMQQGLATEPTLAVLMERVAVPE